MSRWICILAVVGVLMGGMVHAMPAWAEDDHPAAGERQSGERETADGDGEDSHAGEGHEKVDPLNAKADIALFTLVVFLVLLAILWKFAWGPIAAGLDKREQGIANNIARAEEAAEEAHKLTLNYESKLAAAADEVKAMIEEARRDAEHTKQQIVDEAQQAASAEVDRARREIEIAKGAALKELADRTTEFSLDLAGQVLGRELSGKDHAQLISRATDDFMKVDASNN